MSRASQIGARMLSENFSERASLKASRRTYTGPPGARRTATVVWRSPLAPAATVVVAMPWRERTSAPERRPPSHAQGV